MPSITVVTGSRKGIGRFLAERYLSQGHQVYGCSRQESDLSHPAYRHVCLDVSDEKAVRLLFSKVRKEHGRLDNLVNNAGIASMNHALLTPLETVRRILETNVVGTFLFCREASKLMTPPLGGRIVNFASVAVPLQLEGEAAYAASKAAVVSLTEILAREFADLGVTVNAVGPTPVQTDLIRAVRPDQLASLLRRQAFPRLGTFDDVANVVDFFLSPTSGFVTGQTLYLGGVS